MEEMLKNRCGNCGAEIRAQHLGNCKVGDMDVPVGYCERCNAFDVPIGEDEKPYRERMAEAKSRVPKGWSMRQCEDGSLELKRGVPYRWLWAVPIGLAGLAFFAWALENFAYLSENELRWTMFLAVVGGAVSIIIGGFALYRFTARRYRLGKDALVVESLWLGFMPMCRLRFARTEITSGCIEEQGKDFVAVWANGYDRRQFWRGRSKDEAEFIEANLLSFADSKWFAEPLVCGKCGAEFRSEDIDVHNDSIASKSIVCKACGMATDCGDIEYARMVRFRMKFRPQGIVDIPGGFELREGRWWNGALGAAISRYAVVAFIALPVLRLFEKLPAPWVYIPMSILVLLLAVAPVYFIASAIVGRFGVHRIIAQGGRLTYFHGIGKFGRCLELPLDSISDVGIKYRGSIIDNNAVIPSAFLIRIKDERKMKRIFRDCPPIFYHWIEGWFRETLKVSAEVAK